MPHYSDACIVIPLKNGEKYILETLSSCLNQATHYKYEVIIVNDHSTDQGIAKIKKFIMKNKSLKISIIDSSEVGIVAALNQGINTANSKYILRIDQDDVMTPSRVQSQIAFLKANQEVVVVGSQIGLIGENLNNNIYKYPTGYAEIISKLAYGNSFAHPSVAFVRESFLSVGSYRNQTDGCEDYDLWLRMTTIGELRNLETELTKYRLHNQQYSFKHKRFIDQRKVEIQIFWLRKNFKSYFTNHKKSSIKKVSLTKMLLAVTLQLIRLKIIKLFDIDIYKFRNILRSTHLFNSK